MLKKAFYWPAWFCNYAICGCLGREKSAPTFEECLMDDSTINKVFAVIAWVFIFIQIITLIG